MTSTIKIYSVPNLYYDRAFSIDDIQSFLNEFTPIEILDFQYIKHQMNLEIKIDESQSNIYTYSDNLNFMSIQNGDEKIHYYFIVGKSWRSQRTIAYSLKLDVLNTFKPFTDYEFSEKTKIIRQHKNRFKSDSYQISSFMNPQDDAEVLEVINDYMKKAAFDFTKWNDVGGFVYMDDNDEDFIKVEIFNKETNAIGNMGTCARLLINDFGEFIGQDYQGTRTIEPFKVGANELIILSPATDGNATTIEYDTTSPQTFASMYVGIFGIDTSKVTRQIDIVSEGITPNLFIEDKGKIKDDEPSWYLIYKNQNEPSDSLVNPVNAFICAEQSVSIKTLGNLIKSKADFTMGRYFIFASDWFKGQILVNGVKYTPSIDRGLSGNRRFVVSFYRDIADNFFLVTFRVDTWSLNPGVHSVKREAIVGDVEFIPSTEQGDCSYRYGTSIPSSWDGITKLPQSSFSVGQYSIAYLKGIEQIDRTDSKIIKIIKLPYCPTDYSIDTDESYNFDETMWTYNATEGLMQLNNLNTKFKRTFTSEGWNPFDELTFSGYNKNPSTLANPRFESKLFHSDFYLPKFVYDSFTFGFQLETINTSDFLSFANKEFFQIDYVVSSTINSRFMFQFNQYTCGELNTQDYNNICVVTRNNEIALYNQQYINYLRNGYNYDVKNKQKSEIMSWLGVALSTIGTVTSFATGNPVGVASGIALGTATISNLANAISNTIGNEKAFVQKQLSLQSQATSVSGSDDVDIMSAYTDNKAKMELAKCSNDIRQLLFKLFFYYGYKVDKQGIPNFLSRERFNFLQCQAVFNSDLNEFSEDIRSELFERFQNGVTFIHHYNNEWDLAQIYENWEVTI